MDSKPTLSYVLTTYNKLSYLKEVMKDLIANCKSDEEIVVTDGASTDGTAAYLNELFIAGKIHQFVSEKDCGEAHGFNKGILLAKGVLIKLISDDDLFFYHRIQECKNFLLANSHIDILGANGMSIHFQHLNATPSIEKGMFDLSPYYTAYFNDYLRSGKPFPFTGLGLVFRKESVSKFGLLSTTLYRVDYEFGMRLCSNRKVKLAWYTGPAYIRLQNEDSNSIKYRLQMDRETTKIDNFYQQEQTVGHGTVAAVRSKTKAVALEFYWLLLNSKKKLFRFNKVADNKDLLYNNNNLTGDFLTVESKFNLIKDFSNRYNEVSGTFLYDQVPLEQPALKHT